MSKTTQEKKSTDECLQAAIKAISDAKHYPKGSDLWSLALAAAREWTLRAEHAEANNDTFDPSEYEHSKRQMCLSCGAVHGKEICPECEGDSQEPLI